MLKVWLSCFLGGQSVCSQEMMSWLLQHITTRLEIVALVHKGSKSLRNFLCSWLLTSDDFFFSRWYRGANVNAQSQKGDTALHLAAYRGSRHLCSLLLNYGACKNILNNNGKTAQQEAAGAGHTAITNFLAPETAPRSEWPLYLSFFFQFMCMIV